MPSDWMLGFECEMWDGRNKSGEEGYWTIRRERRGMLGYGMPWGRVMRKWNTDWVAFDARSIKHI